MNVLQHIFMGIGACYCVFLVVMVVGEIYGMCTRLRNAVKTAETHKDSLSTWFGIDAYPKQQKLINVYLDNIHDRLALLETNRGKKNGKTNAK